MNPPRVPSPCLPILVAPLMRVLRLACLGLVCAWPASAQTGPSFVVPGFPVVQAPAGNPVTREKVLLGMALFFEEQLSTDDTVACATCHLPEAGGGEAREAVRLPGADGRTGTADDVFGSPGVVLQDETGHFRAHPELGLQPQVTGANSPSAINAAFFRRLFWDLRALEVFRDEDGDVVLADHAALENQAVGPPTSSVEMGHQGTTWDGLVDKLRRVEPLVLASDLPPDLAAFLADVEDYPTLFERAFGDPRLTRERVAMAIASYERTLVSDQTPFDLGTLTPAQERGRAILEDPPTCGVCHSRPLFSDGKRHDIHLPGHAHARKTPSLRNVGLRRRFMHSGQFASLEEVVDHYEDLGLVTLTAQQEADLVDFMRHGLTDPRVAAASGPFARPTLRSERVPAGSNVYGQPRPGATGTPEILAHVPFAFGSPAFKVGLGEAPPATNVWIGVTARQDDLPGQMAQDLGSFPTWWFPAVSDADGVATWDAPVSRDPALIGTVLHARWMVPDPTAAGGFALSRPARFRLERREGR